MSEQTVTFGADNDLVGTIGLPATSRVAGRRVGVLLFNAGIVHRVGPHRLNVRVARELAARGIPTIRFDLAGHGDSARPSGAHSFEAQAVIDVRAAMDALGAAANVMQFAIFGYCSGAYHGFATALEDERVTGLLMFDAYRYPTTKTHLYHYLKGLREPGLWSRFIAFVRRSVTAAAGAAGPPADAGDEPLTPELGRINYFPAKENVGTGLRTLIERGVRISMLYSGGDIRAYNYQNQFRDTFAASGVVDRIPVAFMPDFDHVVTALAAQADLIRSIVTWSEELAGAPLENVAA